MFKAISRFSPKLYSVAFATLFRFYTAFTDYAACSACDSTTTKVAVSSFVPTVMYEIDP